jgi:hypothetical protein
MPHPSITFSGEGFRRDATNLRRLPPIKSIPGKVRLVKDLLRVGSWPIGVGADGTVQKWEVSEATLGEIEQVFARQKAEGQTRPLQWGHADPATGTANVSPEKVIDYWESVWHEDGTLWGEVYVKDEVAEDLKTVKRPVSVGVDYLGNILTPGTVTPVKNALLHVGIVDQGAMPGQGGFVQMAASLEKSPMDFEAVKELVNSMLGQLKDGLTLPEDVTPENIVSVTKAMLSALGAPAAEEPAEEEEEAAAVGPVDPAIPPEMAQMAGPLLKILDKKYGATIAQLNASLALLTEKRDTDKKTAFLAQLDAWCQEGSVLAVGREALVNVGKSNGWDLEALKGLPGVPMIQMGSVITPTTRATSKEAQIKEYEKAFLSTYPPARARRMAENIVNNAG